MGRPEEKEEKNRRGNLPAIFHHNYPRPVSAGGHAEFPRANRHSLPSLTPITPRPPPPTHSTAEASPPPLLIIFNTSGSFGSYK